MKKQRRIIFAFILSIGIAIDMISTHLMVASGYKELTGIIVLMISVSKWLLYLWVIFWWCLVYFSYPLLEKINLNIHIETIAIYYAMISIIAGIGNFYLYYREVLI